MYKFKFADIGEGLHQGLVGEIFVKKGDKVNEGDSLFSVETDKVTSDIPSPVSGIVVDILIKTGDTVHVGDEIFHFETNEATPSEVAIETTKFETNEATPPEVATESTKEKGGSSVVGEIEVSDKLFSFNSFKTPSAKEEVATKPKTITKETKTSLAKDIKTYQGKVDQKFDVIVVGSGPGGYLAAEKTAKYSLTTLIIEKEFWGGVCLNVGCIPTKALLKSVEVHSYINKMQDFGIKPKLGKLEIDWKILQKRKQNIVEKLTSGVEMLLKGSKAKMLFGEAKFLDPYTIKVKDEVFQGKNIILATGSTANKLNLPGFEQGYQSGKIVSSKEALSLKQIPKKLAIIGGGVIGVEFSQIFHNNGSKVKIFQNTQEIMPVMDKDIIQATHQEFIKQGIEILTNVNVTRFKNNKLFYTHNKQNKSETFDKILVAVGRKPYINNLQEIGIEIGEKNNVVVNLNNQTNLTNVYAIGDVVGDQLLAHLAYKHAIIAARHIAGKTTKWLQNSYIPSCVYTYPEIAAVGLTEKQAQENKQDYFIVRHKLATIGKAIADGDTRGFIKLIIDKQFGEILGAHMFGARAVDIISELTSAMDSELTIYELVRTIHPHPTISEVVWEAVNKALEILEK